MGTIIFLLLLTAFLKPPSLFAESSFTTDQKIVYTLDNQNNASVTHTITLQNNLSLVFAKEYIITLPVPINDTITGNDASGSIIKEIKKTDTATVIYLQFKNPSIGRNAQTNFQINYHLNKIVTTKGLTRELELPTAPVSDTTEISIIAPTTFGQLSYSSLKPTQTISHVDTQQIDFKYTLQNSKKILVAFGNNQLFDFQLSYYLSNPTDKAVVKEIPIPPTTPSQKVTLKTINPSPNSITQDGDGNWLAHYQLAPFANNTIQVDGQVKIISETGTTPLIGDYLKATTYWPTQNPQIQEIAQSLKTPKAIYDYVIATLTYDYSRLNNASRRHADEILANSSSALCTDFTDLFITIARAAGIPAREIEGYAYSNNTKIKPVNTQADILHAWPQYYDRPTSAWKSIDPTWGKTTNGIDFFSDLDLNHFAFVIHGQSDDYPPPPGSYKSAANEKSVTVTFAQSIYQPPVQPIKVTDKIFNPNLFSLTNCRLKNNQTGYIQNIDTLIPLASADIYLQNVPFPQVLLPSFATTKLTLTCDQLESPQLINLTNKLHYLYLTLAIAAAILILSGAGIMITRHK